MISTVKVLKSKKIVHLKISFQFSKRNFITKNSPLIFLWKHNLQHCWAPNLEHLSVTKINIFRLEISWSNQSKNLTHIFRKILGRKKFEFQSLLPPSVFFMLFQAIFRFILTECWKCTRCFTSVKTKGTQHVCVYMWKVWQLYSFSKKVYNLRRNKVNLFRYLRQTYALV